MTDREIKILQFLSQTRIATTKQIQMMYFSNVHHTICYNKLNGLIDKKLLKRKYYNISPHKNSYVYYLDKAPSKRNLQHDLLITEFMVQLTLNGYEIISFEKSPIIGGIVPDAEIWTDKGGIFLEIQLSPHECIKKYFNLKHKVERDIPSTLYIVTNQKIDTPKLRDMRIIIDNLSMGGISNV